jgi:flagellin
MSDISLTSGMRANLLSLQSSVKLLDRTQERLSTGKKVNSALDNPTNFFTALSHTSRANDLLGFKDAIAEAIQTIKAADTAVTGIKTLIASAKALAEDAKGQVGASNLTQTLTLNTITGLAGATLSVGGVQFTALAAGSTTVQAGTGFSLGTTAAQTAMNLAAAINNHSPGTTTEATASVSGTTLTISVRSGAVMGDTTISAGATSTLGDAATALFSESAIGTGTGTEMAAKVSKYATFISQITDLQKDAYYKGKNLLGGAAGGSNDMVVRFGNNHSLTVGSFDGSATGLSLSLTAVNSWAAESDITADITKLEAALDTLKVKSSDLSSNLAIVNTRSDWITSIANVLQTGADNLTLADSNEEGANMLMLQTRQSLSTSALSMSAQAAQSVLRLFQ